ncbi:MAG: hypothetical protein LBV72_14835 [Tannerella sp.]|nr:hypothetical protein [Tannerella sp.]
MKGDSKVIYFIENNLLHISFIWVCRQYPKYLSEYIKIEEEEYDNPEEDNNTNEVNEPAAQYESETEMTFSPPLTEEELAEALTTEQVKEHLHDYIHKLFNQ